MENTDTIKKEAKNALEQASSIKEADEAWRKYLGRKGRITQALRGLKDLPEEERKTQGQKLNKLKEELDELFQNRVARLQHEAEQKKEEEEWIDVTRPPERSHKGSTHPLTKTFQKATDVFGSMGFETVFGPHIEDEWHNFEALNIPADHPARDLWDTIWLKPRREGLLMRTHTSPMQVRYMRENYPPFRIVVPGRVYRYEATDATHDFQFHQLEGLMVDENISVANFRAVMQEFLSGFFGKEIKTRLRPSYFPFVEPGFEIDMSCTECEGKGCSVCSDTGWVEMLGAGMVHPKVFESAGYNPKNLAGFAFGIGIDRLAMIKHKIDDVRLFHAGDMRFLKQFK